MESTESTINMKIISAADYMAARDQADVLEAENAFTLRYVEKIGAAPDADFVFKVVLQ